MRIAIVNWTDRRVGGAESYIERAAGGLDAAGHSTALFCEVELPENREQLQMPSGTPIWCASRLGSKRAIEELRDWHPDVIYGNGLLDPDTEAATLRVAPAALFAHGYYGTCISGDKAFKRPLTRPCSRQFGWRCLVHYYPHRCGGLSPITMWSDFKRQSRRLRMLHSYRAILTASEHMRSEYLTHGFAPESIKVTPLPVYDSSSQSIPGVNENTGLRVDPAGVYRLLFVGRMDPLKGGDILLDALAQLFGSIGEQLHMTFVGDGSERVEWKEKAARIQACEPRLKIDFTGWLEKVAVEKLYRESDLLVVPSLWPEPFGLVGPEAGLHGLPAAAFAVGGITEWLVDGLNGHLAPGDPPTSKGLANAIMRSIREPVLYARLRAGALEMGRRFSLKSHTNELLSILEKVAAEEVSGIRRMPYGNSRVYGCRN
jgi:glycosyltransferase involved in cell wall biosynthesis